MRRLKRWLTPGKAPIEQGPSDEPVLPWGLTWSPSGDFVVCLPDASPRLTDVILVPGPQDACSYVIGRSKDGAKTRVTLAPVEAQELLFEARSVLLATGYEGGAPHLVTAVGEPGGLGPFPLKRQRADVVPVLVEKVVDDGSTTGTWRGFVTVEGGPSNVRLALTPAFPVPQGTRIKVIGQLDVTDPDRPRFTDGSWVSNGERFALFGRDMACRFACSITDGKYDPLALKAIEATTAECARAVAQQHGTALAGTFVLSPLCPVTVADRNAPCPSRKQANHAADPAPGAGTIRPLRGEGFVEGSAEG